LRSSITAARVGGAEGASGTGGTPIPELSGMTAKLVPGAARRSKSAMASNRLIGV
jgi:hypothetical protein